MKSTANCKQVLVNYDNNIASKVLAAKNTSKTINPIRSKTKKSQKSKRMM